MWAWCMVVEPKTITSAPSVSMHCSASSVRAGKMSDSFPVSRLWLFGVIFNDLIDAQAWAIPSSSSVFV